MASSVIAYLKLIAGKLTPQAVDDQANPLPVSLSGSGGSVHLEGKATAAAPAYVEGTYNPLSLDLSGNLRTLGGGGGGPVIQNITSSPVAPGPDVNPLADIVQITSSGSAGAEYVN